MHLFSSFLVKQDKICLTHEIHHCPKLRKTKAQTKVVVVVVVRVVVVTIRHTAVPRIVVPAAATVHAVRAFPTILSFNILLRIFFVYA